jgi:catechol 2,3-dioxygenase-like lactoylglutathione lyase family enzyme
MKVNIRHTGIVTRNLKESLFFWKKIFGFRIVKDMNEMGKTLDKVLKIKKVNVRTLKLKDSNNSQIELLLFKNIKKTKEKKTKTFSNGITHISITVKNIDEIYKKYKKKIKFNSEPLFSKDGNVKMTYCKTPEGAFLELVEEL